MAVSQVGSTTTSYYVTNGVNSSSTSRMTSTSSATAVSSTTMKASSASTTSSTTVVSSTTSYASATAKTTCSTTVTYSGASSTAKVSSTTVATVEATSTNKTGVSASTISSSTPTLLEDSEKIESLSDLVSGLKEKLGDDWLIKSGLLNVGEASNTVEAIFDYVDAKVKQEIIYGLLDVASSIIDNAVNLANERNSIDEAEYFADMDYEEILAFRVNNAVNPLCRDVFVKYIDEISIANNEYKGTAYYNNIFNSIYLSEKNDIVNKRGVANTYFHEVGHCIDDVLDLNDQVSNDAEYDFMQVLRSDYDNFVLEVQEKNGLTEEEAYDWIEKWVKEDGDMKNGISDLFKGLSNGEIEGDWAHSDYSKAMIENEAFAHFFEAGMSYKTIKLDYIKEVFPNAYRKFEEMLSERMYN